MLVTEFKRGICAKKKRRPFRNFLGKCRLSPPPSEKSFEKSKGRNLGGGIVSLRGERVRSGGFLSPLS